MPVNLKIVIGLIVVAIASQIFGVAKFAVIDKPGSFTMNLLWIIVCIGIIKGFISRSNISRQLAIGITTLGLLASFYAFYLFLTVPFSNPGDKSAAIVLACIGIIIQSYAIIALFSKAVVVYFKDGNAQPPARADAGSNAVP